MVHLDQLDVVRDAQLLSRETQLNAGIRENIELFFLDIVTDVLGLILGINFDVVAATRIGVGIRIAYRSLSRFCH